MRITEWIFGVGPTDAIPHGILLNMMLFNHYIRQNDGKVKTMLFNVEKDPSETHDLVESQPKVLRKMVLALQEIKHKKPVPIHKYWMVDRRSQTLNEGLVAGDCSEQEEGFFDNCLFVHPWMEEEADLHDIDEHGLVNGLERGRRDILIHIVLAVIIVSFLVFLTYKLIRSLFTASSQEKLKQN